MGMNHPGAAPVMSRKWALAATVAALALGQSPAQAAVPFFGKTQAKKPAEAAQAKPAEAKAPAPAPRRKATAQERTTAQRLDPLARAAFWAREQELDPAEPEAGVALAQALRAMGRNEEAVQAVSPVLLAHPDNSAALMEAARAHIARGQGFHAIEPAKRAQALNPRDWRPVSLLAVAYEQTKRDAEALVAHRQALALAPNDPSALSNLAMYQAGHGEAAEAERLLRRAVALPGTTATVRQNLALVLGLQGKMAEAEALARQDLPPELADRNLAYLRAASSPASATTRSWDALRTP